MQELNELKNLVIQSLEANGALSNIRAQIRASVFKVVDQQDAPAQQPKKPSTFSWENPKCAALLQNPHGTLILQLIKEFLQFYGMDYSNSVFSSEGNIREEVKRDKINGVLQIKELDAKKPLLLQVIEEFYKKGEKSCNTAQQGSSEEKKEKDIGGNGDAALSVVQADKQVENQPEVKQQQIVTKPTEIATGLKSQQIQSTETKQTQEKVPQSQVDQQEQQEKKPEKTTEIQQQQEASKSSESNNKVKTGENDKNDGEGESARGKKALEAVEKFIQKNQDQLKTGEIASLPVITNDNQSASVAAQSPKTQEQQNQLQQTQQQPQQEQQSLKQQQYPQSNGLKYDSEEFDQYEEEGVEEQLEQYQDDGDEEYNEEDYQHGHYASDTHEKASNIEESEDFIGQSSKGHDISVDSYELENFDYITDVEDI